MVTVRTCELWASWGEMGEDLLLLQGINPCASGGYRLQGGNILPFFKAGALLAMQFTQV